MAILKRPQPVQASIELGTTREPSLHDTLCGKAEAWLKRQGCTVTFHDRFKAITWTGEQPDAIGWRGGISILIEVKTSRSDFLADKRKPFRQESERGMGDWRFYMCPPGVIEVDDLPTGWGLLYAHNRKVQKVHGVPSNAMWHNYPNERTTESHRQEQIMLVSALRRMVIRGHFKEIYEGAPNT